MKTFCTLKDTINRVKRQNPEREKIFASHIVGEGFISGIYKELLQLNEKVGEIFTDTLPN